MEIHSLVKNAKEGDKEALLRLILEQKDEYYRLAYVMMKDGNEAMDVMEDMIVILYEKIASLKKEEAFYSWSKTILINCCKAQLKQKKKIVYMDTMLEVCAENENTQQEDRIVLEKHLSKLSIKHSEVIRLKYFMDYDYDTIAKLLKIPAGTVKSRIFVGLGKLKESLGGELL